MSNSSELLSALNAGRDRTNDRKSEELRLVSCYRLCTPRDKRVIWAVLNEYAPLIDA